MTYAQNYTPTTSFANDETSNASGRSTVKTVKVDTEFANISASINALNTNLKLLQRDDGKLLDLIVEPYALSEQSRALVAAGGKPRGNWSINVLYKVGDCVQYNTIAYICFNEHTSSAIFDYSQWMAISSNGAANSAAQQASQSAIAAAQSATTAENAANNIQSVATAAENAKNSAIASATQATNSANSASQSALASQNAADSAQNSAQQAAIAASTVTGLTLINWKIKEISNVLYFQFNGVNKMKLDGSGNLTVTGDVKGFGTV